MRNNELSLENVANFNTKLTKRNPFWIIETQPVSGFWILTLKLATKYFGASVMD